jgi:peptide/nickel transport system substrate-binding protein
MRSVWAAMRRTLPLAVAVATLIVAACTPVARDAGTIVMASGTDLESANPLVTVHPMSRQVQRHMLFVTLVRLDSLLQPVPYYARQWAWDAEHRTVTFELDSSLRWHDGVPTTANDVRFTLQRAADSALGSPKRSDMRVVEQVTVPSPHTVVIRFVAPQAQLPVVLAELPLVPRHLLDTVPVDRWRGHAFATAPVGNGPFRFAARLPGRQWRFVRNDAFPASMGGPPRAHEVVVAVVDEAATKFAGLVSGELDVAGVSPTMARLVRDDPSLRLLSPPVLSSTVLAFNTARAPFDDARARRAVSLSVRRQQLVDAAVAGFGTPATSAIPVGLPVSPPPAPAPDVRLQAALADSLLDAAGWRRAGREGPRRRNGQPLELTLLTVGSGDMAVEQLVQADLAARGITVNIRVLELASFLATVRNPSKTFDVVLTGIPGDIALGHLSALFDSQQRGGALDYTGFHTPALDAALAAARTAPPERARAAWHTVDSHLQHDMPIAWLYHARGVQGTSARLQHVTMDLRGELVTISQWTRRAP